jgi:hypothetical protein
MTSPEQHLDLDTAAALDEGLDIDDVQRAHAASCAECARRLGQVRSTRALLSALPDETMPAAVAERLSAAFPREPALNTIIPAGRRRQWLRSPALAGMVAAAAAIALVAAISIGSLRSSGNGGGTAGTSGGPAIASAPRVLPTNIPLLATGTHYTDANALDLVTAFDNAVRSSKIATPSAGAGAATRSTAKQAFTLDSTAPVPASLRTLHDNRQALLDCVAALSAGPLLTPIAIDFAQFSSAKAHLRNVPAAVILLARFDGKHDAAYIVGPRCDRTVQDVYDFKMILGSG